MSIVSFDVDEAEYIGGEEDGVYYQTAEGPDGWYMTAVVDCDTGGFCDNLTTDDGPHDSDNEARAAGIYLAVEWCSENAVLFDGDAVDKDLRDTRRGRCYELAGQHILNAVRSQRNYTMRLCHGWPILQGNDTHSGKRFGHAWVERTTEIRYPLNGQIFTIPMEECWDTVTEDWIPKALYYMSGRIEPEHVSSYTVTEARTLMVDTQEFGPWVESPYEGSAPFVGEGE
jgi:hypothetical protein